jgi:hypothetical protein
MPDECMWARCSEKILFNPHFIHVACGRGVQYVTTPIRGRYFIRQRCCRPRQLTSAKGMALHTRSGRSVLPARTHREGTHRTRLPVK